MMFFRYAEDITIGDDLLVQINSKLIPKKVIQVSSFTMQGDNVVPKYNF